MSKDDGRITFSADWKEFELRALQEAAAPLYLFSAISPNPPRPRRRPSFSVRDRGGLSGQDGRELNRKS
jgi:hypothetical protein